MAASAALFASKVLPSCAAPRACGNAYSASLFLGLASLLDAQAGPAGDGLEGKTVLLFSYGSGLAGSMFFLRGRTPPRVGRATRGGEGEGAEREAEDPPEGFTIARMVRAMGLGGRLLARRVVSPAEMVAAYERTEGRYRVAIAADAPQPASAEEGGEGGGRRAFTPEASPLGLAPGTWYLTGLDSQLRRSYQRRGGSPRL